MSVRIDFTKGHGTENDFVVVDDPDGPLDLDATAVTALADRRTGIGGDGVIRAVRSHRAGIDAPGDAPEWFMDYRNADGSIAEMCGNGVRVLAAHLQRSGHVAESRFEILTRAGVRTVEILARPADPAGPWGVRGPRHVAMRVHERGVGETRSCGTGVAAVAIAAARRAGDDSREPWTVDVPGGRLQVGWDTAGDILLTGPAQLVADGTTLA